MSFEEAASVFQDTEALNFEDADHSDDEPRQITVSLSRQGGVLFLSDCDRAEGIRIITARTATPQETNSTRTAFSQAMKDDRRPEYDLTKPKHSVKAKYHEQATAETNLVLVNRELAKVFPDSASVNPALRVLPASPLSRPDAPTKIQPIGNERLHKRAGWKSILSRNTRKSGPRFGTARLVATLSQVSHLTPFSTATFRPAPRAHPMRHRP